ncbi:MAG TPA: CAAX prenyl protease-related protein [Fimbriimonadaceae bacterium]|nr:CAAX prenyl protease-related protein [Fimbriimonadaceae bacterium]
MSAKAYPAWVPYVVPMGLFLAITAGLEGQFEAQYPLIYIAKVILVTAALIYFRSTWKDIKFDAKQIPLGLIVGLVVFALWVWIENNVSYPHFLGERTAYNPFEKIPDEGTRTAFLGFRFFGLVLMVPLMEELFWRSFLMRYASNPDFQSMAVGEATAQGFAITVLLFAGTHPEWLVALLAAAAYGGLVMKTKALFPAFVAHLVTNLALGIYVVTQRDWKFW